MKRTSSAHHSNAFGFAVFVGMLILLLIVAAFAVKVIIIFQQSVFDGKSQFSLEIQEPQAARFVIFSPQDTSIRTVLIRGNLKNPQLAIGTPVDASIQSKEDIVSFSELVNKLLLERKQLHATLTIVDGINLFIFTHTADTTKTISEELSLGQDASTQDVLLSKVFTDEAIYKEGESVAIVNGTGIAGLGNKISRLLMHLGVNVVSVTTADTPSPKSIISYAGNPSYTLMRLVHIFGLPSLHLSTPQISDITITLGTDKANSFQE